MFTWFFKLFSKRIEEKHIYRCQYVLGANLTNSGIAAFKLSELNEVFVSADSLPNAQIELAKKIPMTPHVYIHEIKKVLEVIP